jgi:WD40 repeat protein
MSRNKPVEITAFKGHSERVISVVFSPNGQLIASTSYDNTVKLWNPRTSQIICTFPVQTADEDHNEEYKLWIETSSKPSFSQDGTILTLGNGYNALIAWKVDTGEVVKKYGDAIALHQEQLLVLTVLTSLMRLLTLLQLVI